MVFPIGGYLLQMISNSQFPFFSSDFRLKVLLTPVVGVVCCLRFAFVVCRQKKTFLLSLSDRDLLTLHSEFFL